VFAYEDLGGELSCHDLGDQVSGQPLLALLQHRVPHLSTARTQPLNPDTHTLHPNVTSGRGCVKSGQWPAAPRSSSASCPASVNRSCLAINYQSLSRICQTRALSRRSLNTLNPQPYTLHRTPYTLNPRGTKHNPGALCFVRSSSQSLATALVTSRLRASDL